ncbi:MAG: hypothetical protein NC905_01700 [Candidatus Omnitrophica bacterium]|nr:hypothetical protein [Candidatus Omnitrophota bacterium]MCM8776966.1 hypothetical protein [Candidatus Omnitrophota bacterium]
MSIVKWSEDKIHKMNMWDIALVKFVCVFFGLILGAYISEFVRQYIWIFLILFLAGYITAIYRFFSKR